MKTLILKTKTNANGYIHLDLATDVTDAEVEVVVVVNELRGQTRPIGGLLDLVGKLQWRGDALAEQRRLRDEW